MYEYNAIINNIVDGDTFDLSVDLGFNIWYNIRVRLLDIDTPEIRIHHGKDEKEAGNICKQYAIDNFLSKECIIKSYKGTDSFGRYLVDCYIDNISILDIYNNLGINKLNENYSEENVLKLKNE